MKEISVVLILISVVLSMDCEGVVKLTNYRGTIRDNDHGEYLPDLNCTWIIDPSLLQNVEKDMILLVFESMSIEYYADFITVFSHGLIHNDNLIYNSNVLKSENEIPPVLSLPVTESPMLLNFITDSGGQREGFTASVYIGFCQMYDGDMNLHTTKTNSDIPLISNNYHTKDIAHNRPYRNSATCIWYVFPGEQKNAGLYFHTLDLSPGDKIIVKDSANPQNILHIIEGRVIPAPLFHEGGLVIEFSSSKDSIPGFGFESNVYFDECPPYTVHIESPHGIFSDGSAAGQPYKTGRSCSWVISPKAELPVGGYIAVDFSYLELNGQDTLTIYNGDRADETKIVKTFTSNTRDSLNDIRIASSNIYIELSSIQGPPNRNGFQLEWNICNSKCLACGAGTYYVAATNECVPCPQLEVALTPGLLKCARCPEGTFWSSPSECIDCPPGMYGVNGTRTCINCVYPLVSTKFGSPKCDTCPADTIPSNTSYCEHCPDKYIASKGDTKCTKYVHNDDSVIIIYVIAGISLLVIGAVVFVVYSKKKKSDPWDDIY